MKKDRTQIKLSKDDVSLLLFALQEVPAHKLCPKQWATRRQLEKRLLKADERIEGEIEMGCCKAEPLGRGLS